MHDISQRLVLAPSLFDVDLIDLFLECEDDNNHIYV